MAGYFPDMWFHGAMGHLYPWDVRFDPDDAAHLSRDGSGRLHYRVVTEPAFQSVHLVGSDGNGVPMENTGTEGSTQVWELTIDLETAPHRYSFALQTIEGSPVYRVPAGIANAVERLDRWTLEPDRIARVDVPEWARGAVIYQIFPERFHSGDETLTPEGAVQWGTAPRWLDFQGGDLIGIAERSDYLAELGVDAVYINPIFRSPSTHRYDAIDYYEVDPALGGNEGLMRLVRALHDRNIRLIVDASFNHCHPRFFAFADVIENGAASAYRDWFVVDDYPIRVVVRPDRFEAERFRDPDEYLEYLRRFREDAGIEVEERSDEGPAVQPTYEAWYGVPSLPRVNLAHPDARRYFLDVARFWVREFGIDGWRMDVARYVDFDFWPEFRAAVKAEKTDAYLIAEIMGDAGRWLQGDTFDATMNYTFRQLCLDFLAYRTSTGGSLAEGLVRMYAQYAPAAAAVSQNLIGSHDTARFLHEAGESHESLALATILQLTLPGAPGLYYGDEVGMSGGEEPASRGAFPWHAPEAWHREQLDLVTAMTALRRRHPALVSGDLRIVGSTDDAIAFVRAAPQGRVLVAINRSEDDVRLRARLTSVDPSVLWGSGAVEEVDGGVDIAVGAGGALLASV